MSTHKIGFYEDLTKIIFELSSNVIKYAPYFFCSFYINTKCTGNTVNVLIFQTVKLSFLKGKI